MIAAQEVAEGDVDRRAIVDRADAHLQDAVGAARGLLGQPCRPGPDGSRPPADLPVPWRGDAEEVGGARAVDQQEGAEDRRDENGAAGVRRRVSVSSACGSGVRGSTRRSTVAAPSASRSAAPRPVARPNCCASWPSRLSLCEIAARAADLVAQHGRVGEVLEQRDDVGERLVEGVDVGVASAR